jgi:photosystem II stability/assembly factor-like uncharacterized protein
MKRFAKQGLTSIGLALLLMFVAWRISSSAGVATTTEFGLLRAASPAQESQAFSSEEIRETTFASGARHTSPSASEAWEPYPIYGGEMTSIAMGSVVTKGTTRVETVYVGTRDAGVFKTLDGGQSWRPARTGLTFFPIRTLLTDPQDPTVLYAGTDYDGVWKTTDGGDNWSKSSSGLYEGLIVFDFEIDPQDTDTLYAGLGGGVGLVIGNVYKSEDGGATWTMKDTGMPRSSEATTYTNAIFTLGIDPSDPSLLYAGTNSEGAFRSTNGGETWTAINDGLPFRPNSTEHRKPVNALASDPHHDHRLSGIIGGEYYIFEAGKWQKVSYGTYDVNTSIARAYLYFHPAISTTLYSAGDRFSKSTDGGINWTRCLGWPDSGHVEEIAFHRQTLDTVYAATTPLFDYVGGVYRSSDQGEAWSEARQGIMAATAYGVAVDPQDSDHIYAGTGSGSFYRSQDGGTTWGRGYYTINPEPYQEKVYHFGAISGVAVDPLDSRKIYVAATDFYTSTDQGETFQEVDQVEYPECIDIAADSSAIYVGASFGRGVYRSTSGGSTWSQITETLPLFGSSVCPILSIAVDPNDRDTVWAGMQYGGGIARSTDGGDTWHVKGLTETNFVEAIAVDPTNSDEILAGGGFWEGSIFKSTDGGETWQEKASGIAFVQDFVYDPRNPRWVYAATEGYGVLRSFDGGESWHDYSSGIFYPVLYSLDISTDDPPLLVAGSYGSGLYWIRPAAPKHVFLPLVVRSNS